MSDIPALAFFWAVLGNRAKQGLGTGVLAASATAGTLVGFGIIRDAPVYLLNTIAHTVYGVRALATRTFDPALTLTGLGLHYVALVAYGLVFAALCGKLRGQQLLLAAILLTSAVVVLDLLVLPPVLRPGFENVLGVGELTTVYVEMAVAMALGARIFAPRAVVA